MLKKTLILLSFAILLVACMPSQQPTVDAQAQINTAVAGTMQVNRQIEQAVQQTVAAKENTAATPTSEAPADAAVAFQVTATETPFLLPSFTPTFKPTQPKYSCSAVTLKPKTNELFPGGIAIDIKWRVTNTGTATWYDSVDMKYVAGADFANFNRIEFGKQLKPGESIVVEVDATTPKKGGSYFMSWLVDGPMCYGYVTIKVK